MLGPAALLTVASVAHHALHGPSSEATVLFEPGPGLPSDAFGAAGLPDAAMLAIIGFAFLALAVWDRRRRPIEHGE